MKARIATILLAVSCILLIAQPAVADATTWDGLPTANCTAATISGSLTGYTVSSATDISMTGTITPCAIQGPSVYFGYISYGQSFGQDARPVMPYSSILVTDASTTLHLETWSGVHAICLASSTGNRLACASVTIVNGLPTLAPIPITDSRVVLPYSSGKGGGQGNCATCL